MQPSLVDKLKLAIQKNSQTQYSSVIPMSRDMPPLASAGKVRPAMPDMVRAPLESLLNILSAFENPGQVSEQVVPDMINVFLAGRTGTAASKIKLPTVRRLAKDPGHSYELAAASRLMAYDPQSVGGAEIYGAALSQVLSELGPKPSPKGTNVKMEPRKVENTTYKLKGK